MCLFHCYLYNSWDGFGCKQLNFLNWDLLDTYQDVQRKADSTVDESTAPLKPQILPVLPLYSMLILFSRVISLLSQDSDGNSHMSLSQKGGVSFLSPLLGVGKHLSGPPESFPS